MKTIYGHEVKNLESCVVVSHEKAMELIEKAKDQDKTRKKHGLTPMIKQLQR